MRAAYRWRHRVQDCVRGPATSASPAAPGAWGVALWALGLASGLLGLGLYLALRDAGLPAPAFLDNAVNALLLPTAGLLILLRRPHLPLGWVLCAGGAALGVALGVQEYAAWALTHPGWPGAVWAAWVGGWLWAPGFLLAGCSTLLLPAGRPVGRTAQVAWWAVVGVTVVLCVGIWFAPGEIQPGAVNPMPTPTGAGLTVLNGTFLIGGVLLAVGSVLGALLMLRRWRGATGRRREAYGWLALGAWLPVSSVFAASVPVIGEPVGLVALPAYAIVLAATLVRFDVLDTDTASGRTAVWVGLTGGVIAAYVVLVALSAGVAREGAGLSIALAATGLVALAVAPLRSRLQRGVDRLVHGGRADPYATVAGLSRRLGAGPAVDEVLPAVVMTVVEELRLPYAAVVLPDGSRVQSGEPVPEQVRFPVVYLDEQVGELVVGARRGGLGGPERRLLTDLARQCAAAVHGVALIGELRASREQLVRATEAERSRLRRELHDDLGATLAGAAFAVDAVQAALPCGGQEAARLGAVRSALGGALGDLRRVIDGLRPPALDELGLAGALGARLRELDRGDARLRVEVEPFGPLPPAVEVAAFHIGVEASGNAVRHAHAGEIVVRVHMRGDVVVVEVDDDGCGVAPERRERGVGMASMRERAEQLGGSLIVDTGPGGGTSVRAELPLRRSP